MTLDYQIIDYYYHYANKVIVDAVFCLTWSLYPCSTNHVEINDVCFGLHNAEL